MAVVWLFRLAYVVAPVVARWCFSTGCDANQVANALAREWEHFTDPGSDPADLSHDLTVAAGAPEGGTIVVTDFTGTFELRKLQWRFSRAPASRIEDTEVMTFHFIKATGGTPGTWNDSTDLAAVETAFNTLTNSLIANYHSFVHSDQYRWYKDGPAFYHEDDSKPGPWQPNGDNPAIRITEVDRPGTCANSNCLPPQCSLSVTEIVSSRKHWGRFYLPCTNPGVTDATGLLTSGQLSSYLGACVTAYNACRAASVVPVVFSLAKTARPGAHGTLPAVGAAAYEVTSLQMDDIIDVIRSRRWEGSATKTRTALT